MLVNEGLITTSQPITTYVPALVGTSFEGCTVQHLLDFRAGIKFSEDYAKVDADVRVYKQVAVHRPRTLPNLPACIYDYMTTLKCTGAHGGAFNYQSILTDLFGWVLEEVGGMPFAELLSDRIWSRIGAEYDAEVTVDPGGCALADGGIYATARDHARLGLAHLPANTPSRPEIVPVAWLHQCTRCEPEFEALFAANVIEHNRRIAMYHNNWWVLDPTGPVMTGLGINGQMLSINAATNTVIAKFSTWPTAVDDKFLKLHLAKAKTLAASPMER